MEPAGTVLILSHVPGDWAEARVLLSDRRGYRILMAANATEAMVSLTDAHVDLIIAENGANNDDGVPFLARLKRSHPDVVRLLAVSAQAHVPPRTTRDAAIYQFLHKPIDAEQFALVVQRGLEARDMTRRHRMLARDLRSPKDVPDTPAWSTWQLHGEARHFETVVYVSEVMDALCARAAEAANTDLPIIIQGEPGTGKEWLARAIHTRSSRHAGPFCVQRCSGFTDAQLSAELFGHPAEAGRPGGQQGGLFRAAQGGSIFLHDIAETSKAFQTHLLRFLEHAKERVAGGHGGASPARIIAASARPLKALAAEGDFRQDLYIRLRGFELDVPALRERTDDIPVLAEAFMARHGVASERRILGISASALEKLAAYDFPGNVGELECEIRRMIALAKDGDYLTTQLMSPAILQAVRQGPHPDAAFLPAGTTLKDKVESLERYILREALLRHKWNRSRVAEALGLSRVGLANKIRRYGLDERR